jgi:DNA-directed RNA polymerase specialized sigma24 family protein
LNMSEDKLFSRIQNETSAPHTQLSRYRGLLYFVASRVLEDRQGAEEAVENCLLAATRNPPTFDCEGAFRSWLLRILIDEALQILHQERSASTSFLEPVCGDSKHYGSRIKRSRGRRAQRRFLASICRISIFTISLTSAAGNGL